MVELVDDAAAAIRLNPSVTGLSSMSVLIVVAMWSYTLKSEREQILCIATPDGKATATFNLGCLLPIVLAGPLAMLWSWTSTKEGSDARVISGMLAFFGTPIGLIAIARSVILLKSFKLTVTTTRCTLERGFASKSKIDVSNKNIRSVQVDRSLIDRMLGNGTISITTTGDIPEIVIPQVANPDHVADCIKRVYHG